MFVTIDDLHDFYCTFRFPWCSSVEWVVLLVCTAIVLDCGIHQADDINVLGGFVNKKLSSQASVSIVDSFACFQKVSAAKEFRWTILLLLICSKFLNFRSQAKW